MMIDDDDGDDDDGDDDDEDDCDSFAQPLSPSPLFRHLCPDEFRNDDDGDGPSELRKPQ